MFVSQVDFVSGGRGVVNSPNGIIALAVDPGSDLDVCRVAGSSILRPTGLWLPQGKKTSVNLEAVRNTTGLDLRECSQIVLQVFEPGDAIVAPPKRASKVYQKAPTLALTTATFVGAFPFTGRRAVKVSCVGPSGSVCTVRVVGRSQATGNTDLAQELGADTFTTSAASAQWAPSSGVSSKLQAQARYYGGTDSLEMWDELHVFANSDTAGLHVFLVEVSDEVNG